MKEYSLNICKNKMRKIFCFSLIWFSQSWFHHFTLGIFALLLRSLELCPNLLLIILSFLHRADFLHFFFFERINTIFTMHSLTHFIISEKEMYLYRLILKRNLLIFQFFECDWHIFLCCCKKMRQRSSLNVI